MKNFIVALSLIFLVSCEDDVYNYHSELTSTQAFEGYFQCENNSSIELLTDFSGAVYFDTSGQNLNSINPENGTLGTHPVISDRDVLAYDNQLILKPRNYNYSSSTSDIEEDISGSNITNSRRTDLSFRLEEDTLKIEISIYQNALNKNINSVVAFRTFTCERL